MAEKLVPGEPIPMTRVAELLWRIMQGGKLEMVGLDLRGEFRVGGDAVTGSISGGKDSPWKLYLQDSWEYRYLTDRELRSIRIRKCDRILGMFREEESGNLLQGRLLQGEGGLDWRFVEMVPQDGA
jgi:hypothetical protein